MKMAVVRVDLECSPVPPPDPGPGSQPLLLCHEDSRDPARPFRILAVMANAYIVGGKGMGDGYAKCQFAF